MAKFTTKARLKRTQSKYSAIFEFFLMSVLFGISFTNVVCKSQCASLCVCRSGVWIGMKVLGGRFNHSSCQKIVADVPNYLSRNWISQYTAYVYRGLQGLYGEIRVGGFQIYGDFACIPAIPVILKSPNSDFHCNICREFAFTWILWGFPALDVGLLYDGVANSC